MVRYLSFAILGLAPIACGGDDGPASADAAASADSADAVGPADAADTADDAPDVAPDTSDAPGAGAADPGCPTAAITIAEGDEVLPQSVLHLDGGASTPAGAAIVSYEWSVVQPGGSESTFAPSPYVVSPTFEADVIGIYTFRLAVRDALGTMSCTPAERIVAVTSDDAIHVELLWDTPGDLNQRDTGGDSVTSSAGADVDLHFLHGPDAAWFDPRWDCYSQNPNPEWGGPGAADNPRTGRDDSDGAGPEDLNVTTPEQGARYEVGVYYENAWGYGHSFATVRVYVYGVLRDEWSGVELAQHDLWASHLIAWPSGIVTRIGDTPQITHDVRH